MARLPVTTYIESRLAGNAPHIRDSDVDNLHLSELLTREIFASCEHVFTARKIQYTLYNWRPDKFWKKKKRKKRNY